MLFTSCVNSVFLPLQRNLELFRRCILAAAAQVSSHGGCFFSRPSAGVQAETWARLCWQAHVVLTDLCVNRESVTASFPRGCSLLFSRSYQLCKVCYFRSKIAFLEVIWFHQSAVTSSVNTSEPRPCAVHVEAIFGAFLTLFGATAHDSTLPAWRVHLLVQNQASYQLPVY